MLRIWGPLAVVFLLDRLTKVLIRSGMELGESIPVIPDIFHLTYILNSGAAFGILAGQGWLFIIVSLVAICLLFIYRKEIADLPGAAQICVGLISGGAIGNLFDRLWIGKVIDFLDFRIWPYIFNVADSGIVVGGFLLTIVLVRLEVRNEKQDAEGEHV